MLMRYKESPEPPPPGMFPPALRTRSCTPLSASAETTLMASDGCEERAGFDGFSLSLSVPTEADADRAFAALADGGQVDDAAGQDRSGRRASACSPTASALAG